MSLCSFASNHHIFDVTPVENLFIQEFMLKAPGDYVKIYLYGINQCYHPQGSDNSIAGFARALSLDEKTVESAFYYWERQGVLKVSKKSDNGLNVEYYNIKDAMYNKNIQDDRVLYKYKDFNQNLQTIFESRLLSPQDYLKVYDWLELLHLPQEVVLMMVKFYITKKGSRININYIDKIAEQWAKDEINTLQKAEEYIETFESCYQGTVAVLKYLGIKRSPTKAELELYKKWTTLWSFSLNAILTACKETTKTASPNFAYLDRILHNMHVLGVTSKQNVNDYLANRAILTDKIKEVFFHAGHKEATVTPEHQVFYNKWVNDWKFEHESILLACKQCVVSKSPGSFETIDQILKQWSALGLLTNKEISAFLSERQTGDEKIWAVFEACGENRAIKPPDRLLFKKWLNEWNMPLEVILLASGYSSMADNKLTFINKILASWHKSNIKTADEARLDHEQHVKSLKQPEKTELLKKKVDFSKFEQHPISENELDHLFENIENN